MKVIKKDKQARFPSLLHYAVLGCTVNSTAVHKAKMNLFMKRNHALVSALPTNVPRRLEAIKSASIHSSYTELLFKVQLVKAPQDTAHWASRP